MAETLGWSSAGRCKPSIGTQSDHERGRWLDLWTAVLSIDVELQSKEHHWQGFMLFLVYIYPPTPALAKAGAAPGTTAGVELAFLSNRHPKATSNR